MARATLRVTGTTCPSCERTVATSLRKEAGVREVRVSHREGTAVVVYDESVTSPDRIVAAPIFRSLFSAEVVQ